MPTCARLDVKHVCRRRIGPATTATAATVWKAVHIRAVARRRFTIGFSAVHVAKVVAVTREQSATFPGRGHSRTALKQVATFSRERHCPPRSSARADFRKFL